MPLQPRQPQLRGTCERAAKELAASTPGLRVARGWYLDAAWGDQEHWWCVDADGVIHDPTVEQFPTGHIPALRSYQEYDGSHPCAGCGIRVQEKDSVSGFCCGPCYGATIGLPVGRCSCS